MRVCWGWFSRWHHGLAMQSTYREVLHLKINYHTRDNQYGDLFIVKVSQLQIFTSNFWSRVYLYVFRVRYQRKRPLCWMLTVRRIPDAAMARYSNQVEHSPWMRLRVRRFHRHFLNRIANSRNVPPHASIRRKTNLGLGTIQCRCIQKYGTLETNKQAHNLSMRKPTLSYANWTRRILQILSNSSEIRHVTRRTTRLRLRLF